MILFVFNKIAALGLCVCKEESYFKFNDFYVWFISDFVSRCHKEKEAKFIRVDIGRLHMFGWIFV